ncbi:MAG: radical SAM protein [Blastocatellia bacterium]|nr:radical SAM protein [Blastocatellia bacterium]
MKKDRLDCIIIGFYERDYDEEIALAREAKESSGFYRYLQWQFPEFRGARIPIMDLLNHTLKEATGRDHRLNMAEMPNLGAITLKSFLCRRNLRVEIVNFFNREKQRLIDLLAQSPSVVAITTTYYEETDPVCALVKFIRQHSSGTKIAVGGPYIFDVCFLNDTEAQDELFREMGADIYIHDSQGELTLSMTLEELRKERGQDLSRIPNLIYTLDNEEFHRTERVVESNDMDENSVDWQHFDRDYYTPTVPMRTARSCAYSCAFCSYPYFAGPLNLTSLPVVERELSALQDAGAKNLMFIDDTFNVPLPRFKELLRMMIRNKFDFKWYSYFRCSNSDDETFDLMAESNCAGVFLGIESGDQNILTNMKKFATVERYKYGIRNLKERGIPTFVSMIIGFPGETRQTVHNTIDFLNETSPMFYRVEMYYHRRSLPIHKEADKYGIRGEDLSWTHNTMDWREGVEMVEEVYRNVKGSAILPVYTFDFWALPYLTGKGFPVEQIERFSLIATEILVQGFNDGTPGEGDYEERLFSVFHEASAAPEAKAVWRGDARTY